MRKKSAEQETRPQCAPGALNARGVEHDAHLCANCLRGEVTLELCAHGTAVGGERREEERKGGGGADKSDFAGVGLDTRERTGTGH